MNKIHVSLALIAMIAASTVTAGAQSVKEEPESKAYLVSNAHLDSQWNWDVQRTISEYVPKTLYRNLMLIDRFPDYIFNCES